MFVTRLILATAALGTAIAAHAAPIATLYSTGVDNAGVAVTGHGADTHWLLNGGSVFTGGTNGSFPIGPWVADTSTARWLTPSGNAADSYDPNADGIWTYTEAFSLAGYKASTAAFAGVFSSDNTVDRITLNGVTIPGSGGSFNNYTAFNSTGATFTSGINILSFTVRNFGQNGGNPTGLRVEVSGTAAVVPEPAMWAMMLAGFGLVGAATRRRARTVAA